MFCVRGEVEVEASLVEVDCQRASLRSRASLVLLNAQKAQLYLWHGCKAHTSARQVAKRVVEQLTKRLEVYGEKQICDGRLRDCRSANASLVFMFRRPSELGLSATSSVKVEEVDEGGEPAEFVKALGGQDKKAYDCMLKGERLPVITLPALLMITNQTHVSTDPGKYNYTPRLFRLTAGSGVFEGEEQLYPARVTEGVMGMPFLQENLYAVEQPGTYCTQYCILYGEKA